MKKRRDRIVLVQIKDSDIATIEALHDLLLDRNVLKINDYPLKRARELTNKMYNEFKSK